jgi:hypothetical protein
MCTWLWVCGRLIVEGWWARCVYEISSTSDTAFITLLLSYGVFRTYAEDIITARALNAGFGLYQFLTDFNDYF